MCCIIKTQYLFITFNCNKKIKRNDYMQLNPYMYLKKVTLRTTKNNLITYKIVFVFSFNSNWNKTIAHHRLIPRPAIKSIFTKNPPETNAYTNLLAPGRFYYTIPSVQLSPLNISSYWTLSVRIRNLSPHIRAKRHQSKLRIVCTAQQQEERWCMWTKIPGLSAEWCLKRTHWGGPMEILGLLAETLALISCKLSG